MNIRQLRVLAEKASKPWSSSVQTWSNPNGADELYPSGPTHIPDKYTMGMGWSKQADLDAEYIQAASPETILKLLDLIESWRMTLGLIEVNSKDEVVKYLAKHALEELEDET